MDFSVFPAVAMNNAGQLPRRIAIILVFAALLHCPYGNIFQEPDRLTRILIDAMRNETWVNSMLREQKTFEAQPTTLGAFPCPALSPSSSVPTSVHQLRPSDIKVVAALGDSYSAARAGGGLCPFNMLFDYRGNSWSIGGDGDYDSHTSMPNILKEYNGDLYGFSYGVGDCRKKLNEAIVGHESSDFAAQANSLVTQLRDDPNVDFESDWKLITVFFGGNDLCEYCRKGITPEIYISNMRAGLDILYNNIPRAFVNLVQVMNVGLTQNLHNGLISTLILRNACPCGTFPETEADNLQLENYTAAYQQGLLDIAASEDYHTDNFTLVAQRFFENLTLPYTSGTDELDYSFFAIDRFHISKRGHTVAGRSLWNSLFEPVGNKSTDVSWYETEIICPTEDSPFLFTNQNSENSSSYVPSRRKSELSY